MKALDFIYYILYQAYVRGNKTKSGAFLVNALWFSLFQYLMLFTVIAIVEINMGSDLIGYLSEIYIFTLIIVVIIVLNLMYIYSPGRINRIKTRFSFNLRNEIAFFYSIIILFFLFLWISVYLAGLLLD